MSQRTRWEMRPSTFRAGDSDVIRRYLWPIHVEARGQRPGAQTDAGGRNTSLMDLLPSESQKLLEQSFESLGLLHVGTAPIS